MHLFRFLRCAIVRDENGSRVAGHFFGDFSFGDELGLYSNSVQGLHAKASILSFFKKVGGARFSSPLSPEN